MSPSELRIGELGEFQLIDRLTVRLGEVATTDDSVLLPIGDDAACLRTSPGRDLLLTTDIQMEGRHFVQAAMSAAEIGARAVSVCVSDIFAMGGRPDHLLISLGLPASFLVSSAEELYDGIRTECARWNCRVVGGNLARCDGPWFVDITVAGSVPAGTAVRRSGAHPGDTIWVSGFPGSSGVGLHLLQKAIAGDESGPLSSARPRLLDFAEAHPWSPEFLKAFTQPQLRGPFAMELRKSGLATAMLDISDGWTADLQNLARASACDAIVRLAEFPRSPALGNAGKELGLSIEQALLSPSDDYELLWAAPKDSEQRIIELGRSHGVPCTPIGELKSGQGLVDITDLPDARLRSIIRGWDHFAD